MIHTLITGGAGFIGSHLTEHLLAKGHRVTVIDDLSTGAIANLDTVQGHENLTIRIGSIMDVPLMAELVDRVDEVYHLAAAVGVRLIVEKPVQTIETNIRGTEILLSLAARKKRKVLLASTSEIYGKSVNVPFREDDDLVLGSTMRPRWGYACSKAIDEFLGLAYCREQGVPVIVVRLFNTVGPRQTGVYGMVIPRFVQQALRGEPITVYGDGLQTRCFGFVGDVVGGIAALMAEPRAVGQVYNVGNSFEITIGELAELVRNMAGSQSEIRLVPFEEAYDSNFEDLARRVPDLSRISSLIGYKPTAGIEEIVRKVIEHERARGV